MSDRYGQYKSSVLRCCQCDDDDCAVCQFLEGSGYIPHLMEVIKVLDEHLANKEKLARQLVVLVAELKGNPR